jgi:hypothetical protein
MAKSPKKDLSDAVQQWQNEKAILVSQHTQVNGAQSTYLFCISQTSTIGVVFERDSVPKRRVRLRTVCAVPKNESQRQPAAIQSATDATAPRPIV